MPHHTHIHTHTVPHDLLALPAPLYVLFTMLQLIAVGMNLWRNHH